MVTAMSRIAPVTDWSLLTERRDLGLEQLPAGFAACVALAGEAKSGVSCHQRRVAYEAATPTW
jgi:hypothetical protein